MRSWILVLLIFSLCACGPKASSIEGNVEGYDLENPLVIKLPTILNEISGLWYYPKDTSLFAIEDEDGFLYKIFPNQPDKILRWKFGKHGDYEDLCLLGDTFFILRSDGDIFATTFPSGDNIESVKYKAPEKGNEYESIYYDDSLKLLILVCKDCEDDKKKRLSTLGFDPVARQYVEKPLEIDSKSIAPIVGEKSIKFKPSAATVNPFTSQLFIIASGNHLLVIAERNGDVNQAYPLNPKFFKQPEGMAFGADRTLYISNESHNEGSATILVFPYKPRNK